MSNPVTSIPQRDDTRVSLHCDSRIVWLFNSVGTSTSLLYWNEILKAYLEHFPNSDFFTAVPPSKAIPGTSKQVESLGAFRIPLGPRTNSYPRRLDIASPRILRDLIANPPDVIVVFEFLALAAYIAAARRWLKNTRVLLLLESDPVRGSANRNRYWKHLMRSWISRRVDLFLTNNVAGQRYLSDQLGISNDRIVTRPYLVSHPPSIRESTLIASPSRNLPGDEPVRFLAVGQLIPRKGMRELILAVAHLPHELRTRMEVRIVGDGTQRTELNELIAARGLESTVQLLGPQSYETLAATYQSSDVFVMPTLDDYRALVGFEALAQGLPILHSRWDGAVHEVIQPAPHENGFVIDPKDTAGFAAQMRWMVEHPAERARMGLQSQTASSRYTISNAVDSLSAAILRCRDC